MLRAMFRAAPVLAILLCAAAAGCSKSEKKDQAAAGTQAKAAATGMGKAFVVGKPAPKYPPRTKVACAELLKSIEDGSKNLKHPITAKAGDWGRVPEELRALPPGAEHCGSISVLKQAVVTSDLAGKDLESFYAPLFAKLDCPNLTCVDTSAGPLTQTRCECKNGPMLGTVTTDTANQSYNVSVVRMTDLLERESRREAEEKAEKAQAL